MTTPEPQPEPEPGQGEQEAVGPQGPAAPRPGSFGDTAGDVGEQGEAEADAEPADEATDDHLAVARMELAERTADLQRLQAEFLNYKRRVDRDRDLVKQNATLAALSPMLEVLDNIDRAREHGELEGGFKGVAEQLERLVGAQGLVRFGEPGDAFDPTMHEALSHAGTSAEVDRPTCQHVAKAGYRIGERVVRAAQVLVVDPE